MEKMVKCKACGKEIAKSAKVCPNCGKKNKKSKLLLGLLIIVVAVIVIAAGASGASGSGSSNSSISKVTYTLENYKAKGIKLNYRSAMLNEIKDDTLLIFKGKIQQIVNDSNLLIQTKEDEYLGYFDDAVYVEYNTKQKVLEDDIVEVYGSYNGTYKYQTVLNAEKEVPRVSGDFIVVLKKQ